MRQCNNKGVKIIIIKLGIPQVGNTTDFDHSLAGGKMPARGSFAFVFLPKLPYTSYVRPKNWHR